MTPADKAAPSSLARPHRRTWLTLFALALLAVLVVLGWWALPRPAPATTSHTAANASIHAAPSGDPSAHELEVTASESAPTRAAQAVEPAPVAAPRRPDLGRILGTVRADLASLVAVTSGFARIDPVPALPGFPRDAAEEARLFVGLPVVVIDREGRFEFPRVPFGDWIVSVQPDGYERREQRVTLASALTEVHVEFMTRRSQPTLLVIALLDETGAPFFENVSDEDRMTTLVMRPALLPTCPPVGVPLAKPMWGSPLLVGENRTSDPWSTLTIPDSDSGCACALIGDFVLAAAPYVARQQRVELQVERADLGKLRKTCAVQVVEAVSRAPLANASVVFHSTLGWRATVVTDGNGWARTGAAVVGPMEIDVQCTGFLPANDASTVRLDETPEARTITLTRAVTLSGRIRRASGENARWPLQLVPVGEKSARRQEVVWTLDNGEFSVGGLHLGEYLLGIPTIERPAEESVRRGKVAGWTYVDARNGDVQGIQVEITKAVFTRSRTGLRADEADALLELLGERAK